MSRAISRRLVFGAAAAVATIPAAALAAVTPDAELLARCATAETLLSAWNATYATDLSDLSGPEIKACENVSGDACLAFHAGMEAVTAVRAQTPAGLAAKARLLRLYGTTLDETPEFDCAAVFEADTAQELAWSIAQDAERLGGAA